MQPGSPGSHEHRRHQRRYPHVAEPRWSQNDDIEYLRSLLHDARREQEAGQRREAALRRDLKERAALTYFRTKRPEEANHPQAESPSHTKQPQATTYPQVAASTLALVSTHTSNNIAAILLQNMCEHVLESETQAVLREAVRDIFPSLPVHVVARWPAEIYRQMLDKPTEQEVRPSTRERVYALAQQEVERADAHLAAEAATNQV